MIGIDLPRFLMSNDISMSIPIHLNKNYFSSTYDNISKMILIMCKCADVIYILHRIDYNY